MATVIKNNTNYGSFEPVLKDMERPVWSVLIPTYNCAHYLKETLESVLIQDPGKEQMEIIVIDDCSNLDNPETVVNEIGKGRVQFIKQTKNVGKVLNYETGIKLSKGQYIHQLHGDDKVRMGFYKEIEHLFEENSSLGAAFCRTLYIDEKSRWTGITGMIQENEGSVANIVGKLYVNQQIQTPSMVVKREVYEHIGGFDRRLNCMEDWEMWTRISNNYPIAVSNKVLAEYRTHDDNATNLTFLDGSALDTHRMVFDIVDSYIPKEIKHKFSKIRNRKQAEFLMLSYKNRKNKLTKMEKLKFIKSILILDLSVYTIIKLIK